MAVPMVAQMVVPMVVQMAVQWVDPWVVQMVCPKENWWVLLRAYRMAHYLVLS